MKNAATFLAQLRRCHSHPIFLLLLTVFVQGVPAATLTVTTLADSGPGSLRQCILDSVSGTEIVFAVNGTNTLYGGELAIGRDLTITGPGPKLLTLNGRLNDRFFRITSGPPVPKVTISGLTLFQGAVHGPSNPTQQTTSSGGAITNAGNLTLSNCVISQCFAYGSSSDVTGGNAFGGAICNFGTLVLRDCWVASSSSRGGSTSSSAPGVYNGGQAWGGGIYNAGTLIGINSTIAGNEAIGETTGNSTSGDGGFTYGGGIASLGDVALTNCTFCGNEAWSTYSGAKGVAANGGGLCSLGSANVVNCTFVENGVRAGGTALKDTGAFGGGICARGPVSIINSLVTKGYAWADTNALGPDVYSTVNSLGHNLIGKADGSSGWVATDLLGYAVTPLDADLGPLQDNGGATPTMRPLANSPVIDRGILAGVSTDQRGLHRPSDLPSVSNAADGCDIGAVETGYVLTALDANAGKIFIDGPLPEFIPGTRAWIYAVPVNGWTLGSWSGAANGSSNPASILMDGDKTVAANFVSTVPDVIMDNPAASLTGAWSTGSFLGGHDCYGLSDYYTAADGGIETATYDFNWYGRKTGNYDFSTWYYSSAANTTNALYQLSFGAFVLSNRLYQVNQRLQGGQWNMIDSAIPLYGGLFGRAIVTLTNGFAYPSHNLVADAVKFSWSTNQLLMPWVRSVTQSSGIETITWFAEPGASYRLQMKTNLADAVWSEVPGDVTANGATASKTDIPAGRTQGFYRVNRL